MATEQKINNQVDFQENLRTLYKGYLDNISEDPFVSPVLQLSMKLSKMLDSGEIVLEQLEQSIENFTLDGLKHRARKLASYLDTCSKDSNIQSLENTFKSLATCKKSGETLPFNEFEEKINKVFYGFVFTAHPTFTMSPELSDALSGYAARLAGAEDEQTGSFEQLKQAAGLPYNAPDINEETALSLAAIDKLHDAFSIMYGAAFKVAAQIYPDQWTNLKPRMATIATWVGFDMDGRKDIQWADTLEKRIELQVKQLTSYSDTFSELISDNKKFEKLLRPTLKQIATTLKLMEEHLAFFGHYNADEDENLSALQEQSRALIKSADQRLTTAKPLIDAVDECLNICADTSCQTKLLVLRATLDTFGLSRSEVHFRINASQLHNAIGSHIRLDSHPDHPSRRHSYISSIAGLIKEAKRANIDFGDIANEKMTAKYEFMLIQQIVKYIDADSQIRFLIAETESAFTILTALYYAKRFGVDGHVDICPLFETGRALQDASKYMQWLLAVPEYQDYLNKRGKLCIQTGYSDAGRYIGQPSAGASIERLKERFATLFEEEKLKGLTLLFFDTHGESVGRGGHPDNYKSRLQYVASPHFLKKLEKRQIPYIQESSYQGGDGFLLFLNKSTALCLVAQALEYMTASYQNEEDDPYYKQPGRTDVTSFFSAATRFQTNLVANPHYAELLASFSTNMMNSSGSRAVKRVATGDAVRRADINQFRAIPNNAILGQFGVLANTISGIGRSFREHVDFAQSMEKYSPRFKNIMALIDRAYSLSDPQILKSYITILHPTYWITKARYSEDKNLGNRRALIATHLEELGLHSGMDEVYRQIEWDYTLLSRFRSCDPDEAHIDMACLHALRITLIRNLFLLAMDIPRYGPHHAMTREKLIQLVLHMDIDSATTWLDSIFPSHSEEERHYDFGETSDYRSEEISEGYKNIRLKLIIPMRHMHRLNKRISTALAHYMGFFG